ncbi:TPA: hypothetical protein SFZ51_001626 [Campylobacter jejuni]|uniref:Uncharacterized protein n=1 Tax=Campylobacter jejuni TaxID=197 RepID=A0A431EEF7_CAMJU|nr:hypothetical protein [Campylobacter jejuni]RTJ79645.1 hypothetical protein C3H57_04540 [Campylobacter jejuni]HEG8092006.1 hypothetical protein [Campylobacter jejuni]HEG8104679.1 hypothetical protein [Campylobacter jejuni]HEG8133842.1 hypothetical protein [Campylobacter jejuni]
MSKIELNSFDCRSRVRRAFKALHENGTLKELGYIPDCTEVTVVNGSDEIIYTLTDRYQSPQIDNYVRWVHVRLDPELEKPTVPADDSFVEIKQFSGVWEGWIVLPKGEECWRMKLYKVKAWTKSLYSRILLTLRDKFNI